MSVPSAVSIWFEIWGSWIRVNRISIFPGKFPRNFDFFQAISQKNGFSGKFLKNFDFSGKFFFTNLGFSKEILEKFRFFSGKFSKEFKFFRQLKKPIFQAKLLISSYFWVNYSIYLQKSPLSNILPVHDTIYHDLYMAPLQAIPSCQKSGASQPPNPPQD